MKKFLYCVLLCGVSSAAMAADLPKKSAPAAPAPVAAPISFGGFYVGLQAGWQGLQDNYYETQTTNPSYYETANGTGSAFVGGAYIGYNYQFSNYVLGVEGDIEGVGGSKTVTLYPGPDYWSYKTGISVQGSARLRAGVVFNNFLVYATGGLAIANVQHDYWSGTVPTFGYTNTLYGWTLGAGVEYAFDANWRVRVEYRYTDLGSVTNVWPTTYLEHQSLTSNAVRLGVGYTF